MVLGRVERYTIEQRPEGVVITMYQGGRHLLKGLVVVAGCIGFFWWWLGFLGAAKLSRWMLCGFWAMLGVFFVLAAFYREQWTISSTEIRINRGRLVDMQQGRREHSYPRTESIKMVYTTTSSSESTSHYLHVLGPNDQKIGEPFVFLRHKSVNTFLRALRPVLPVVVINAQGSYADGSL